MPIPLDNFDEPYAHFAECFLDDPYAKNDPPEQRNITVNPLLSWPYVDAVRKLDAK